MPLMPQRNLDGGIDSPDDWYWEMLDAESQKLTEMPTMNREVQMAFEAIESFPGENEQRWRIEATIKGMIEGYDLQWRSSHNDIFIESIEAEYTSPLFNIETGRKSRTFSIAGKLDKLANQDGRVLFDHKTTSMDIENPDGIYWRQLVIEGQPSHYELLLNLNGIRVERVVWDVIRKPGIRPKKLTKKEQADVISLKRYCDSPISQEAIDEIIRGDIRENGELFQIRVFSECRNNPSRYFQRRSAMRTYTELAEYASELWQIADEIREAQNHKRWYRNSGACMAYNSPCEFLGICSGHDTVDSDRWTKKEHVHSELNLEGDGREFLTNSRIRCFQTCHRKHFYKYELGIERADTEEKEALFFGSMFHAALDAWWLSMSGGETNVNCIGNATIAVA